MSRDRPGTPKISIITPSYNQGKFIRETIDSVLSQNYPRLDYRVVDGGSTDQTLEILRTYGDKIRWVSEKDGGQAEAINKGLRQAGGDIIAYLNSDDVYLPGALHSVAEYFRQHPQAMWLTGDAFIMDEHGRRIRGFIGAYKKLLRRRLRFPLLAVANPIIQPSTFWRRDLLEDVGDFNVRLRYCMDYDFWIRIMKKYPLHVVNDHLSLFRIHPSSKGGRRYAEQFQEQREVIKHYTDDFVTLTLNRIHAAGVVFIYRMIN